jgi:hypothetical protein
MRDNSASVEHRHSGREPLALEVLIGVQRRDMVRGSIRNVALNGLYVSTASGVQPAVHTPVDVWIPAFGSAVSLPCFVAHVKQDGMGLGLREESSRAQTLLRTLIGRSRSARFSA